MAHWLRFAFRYRDRAFMMTRWAGAPTIETYESHPFLAALEAGELDEEVARGYAGGSGDWKTCALH